jgi:hypothetical protein
MPINTFAWWYWPIVWIFLDFGVPEAWALLHRRVQDSFSNRAWVWLGVFTHQSKWHVRQIIFAPFWLYLGGHLAFAWPGKWLILTAIPLLCVISYSMAKGER